MHRTIDDFIAQARQLPADELELLVLRLNHEVALPLDPGVEQAWSAEIGRRIAAIDQGKTQLHDWEDVRKDLGLT